MIIHGCDDVPVELNFVVLLALFCILMVDDDFHCLA